MDDGGGKMFDGQWKMFDGERIFILARSSSGLGRRPLKAETTGSNPVRATHFNKCKSQILKIKIPKE